MHEQDGKTYEQIATKTGLTFHQVKHAINRARAEQQPEPEPEDINTAVLQEIRKQTNTADLVKKYKEKCFLFAKIYIFEVIINLNLAY